MKLFQKIYMKFTYHLSSIHEVVDFFLGISLSPQEGNDCFFAAVSLPQHD